MTAGDRIEATINTCPDGGVFKINGPYTSLSPLLDAKVTDVSGQPVQIEAVTIPDKPESGVVTLDVQDTGGGPSQAKMSLDEFETWVKEDSRPPLVLDRTTGVLDRGSAAGLE